MLVKDGIMARIIPLELEDGSKIYVEATVEDNVESSELPDTTSGVRRSKGGEVTVAKFQVVEDTIRAYTQYTLNAFKQLALANVEKVTLEFGFKVSGEAGIPYITKGTAESNLKITVQCTFPATPVSQAHGSQS
jgi:Trypsin-co-occurring domain 1